MFRELWPCIFCVVPRELFVYNLFFAKFDAVEFLWLFLFLVGIAFDVLLSALLPWLSGSICELILNMLSDRAGSINVFISGCPRQMGVLIVFPLSKSLFWNACFCPVLIFSILIIFLI